jgi:2-amino-4-hydroxy-6-hydroxymethyldihydropteridine diphosphokinase
VGLGSNLNNPIEQVKKALQALKFLPNTHLKTQSALYHSRPLGSQNQPNYINAVAMLVTKLPPLVLLDNFQAIENKQGRVRGAERWGPRTLDLDLLLYDNLQLQKARLILPHPGLYERNFVLYPLYDCSPDLILPNGQAVSILIRDFDGLDKITENCR